MGRLAKLAAERALTADQVAASKWLSGRSIEDPVRERQVLEGMDAQARELGVDRALVQEFFKDQIEANKLIQYGLHEYWRNNPAAAPMQGPDLDQVRVEINRINAGMLTAIREYQPLLSESRCAAAVARAHSQVAENMKLDELHKKGLRRALQGLCATP